ncbi:MAG: glycosyltransferase family 2 protein [Chloroflexi bacterium]|nr:glycosyltransferase family 2 protein [Chloroflexota bacterium]
MTATRQRLDLSIVVPVRDEEESLEPLYNQLAPIIEGKDGEIIFVDDGSRDGSFRVLQELHEMDPAVKVIRFRRNFGKTAALSAGFQLARGEKVVTIDADLQNDPADIPSLCSKLDEGYDLVSGWRSKRIDPRSKRLLSLVFNWIVRSLTGIRLHDFNCGLKAYRRQVISDLTLYGELHRFIPVLANWRGFRVTEIAVNHRSRVHGRSKYDLSRLSAGFLDFVQVLFLTSYMRNPLRLFGSLGIVVFAIGLIIFTYLVAIWFGGASIGRRPLLILAVLLMVAGLQLVCTGLIGEMLRNVTYNPREEFSIERTLD